MSGRSTGGDGEARHRILAAAERQICCRGLREVTMLTVAEEAGLPVGRLYQHFRSKESLCTAVAVEIVRALNEAVESRVAGLRGFRKLRASCEAVAAFRRDNPRRAALLEELGPVAAPDSADENLRELVLLVRENQRLPGDAVKEMGEHMPATAGIDPAAQGQFLRMAWLDARSHPPLRLELLDRLGTGREDFVKTARDRVYRSLLLSPEN